MLKIRRMKWLVSFLFLLGTIILVGALHMATPLLAALFAYLALTKLHFLRHRGKWLAILLFLILVAALAYALAFFINQAVKTAIRKGRCTNAKRLSDIRIVASAEIARSGCHKCAVYVKGHGKTGCIINTDDMRPGIDEPSAYR